MKNQPLQIPTQGVDTSSDVTTWALPDGAIARLGRGYVKDIVFSPDGHMLAVGSRIGLWWYELSTMAPIALWERERGMILALAFAPNGQRLATGNSDGHIKVWDVQRGECVAEMERLNQPIGISQLTFSPDGQRLAVSCTRNDIVHIWHPETGAHTATFSDATTTHINFGRPSRPLTFSPDICLLAAASPDETLRADFISVWDVATSERIARLRGNTDLVYALSFSPCGEKLVSGARDGTLQVWEVATEQKALESKEYSSNARVIPTYSPSGTLLAAGVYKSTIAVWDVERSEKLDTFEHRGAISALRFSNGTQLAVASPLDFKVWSVDKPGTTRSISGHTNIPYSLTFFPDGQRLASVGMGLLTYWDVAEKRVQGRFRAKALIRAVYISADGSVCALGSRQNTLSVWDSETDEPVATFTQHPKGVRAVACAPTGDQWASGDIDGNMYVWDGKGKQTALAGHIGAIRSIAFAPDGKRIGSASKNEADRVYDALVWDVASGQELASLCLTRSRDETKYKGDADMIQRQLRALAKANKAARPTRIQVITFSPCGSLIAGGLWQEIRLWDATTYEIRMSIFPPLGCQQPFALTFSPCGQYLASGTWWQGTEKTSIRLWEVASGENIATFWGHPTDVQSLAFSPDGALLASGGYDGTILLWDMKPYL